MAKHNDSDILLGLLGIGAAGYAVIKHSEVAQKDANINTLRSSYNELLRYYNATQNITIRLNRRKNTLEGYSLHKTINNLSDPERIAYIESLNCFLFGNDLAASTMICLTIEILIRKSTNDQSSRLIEVIDKIVNERKLSDHVARDLNLLRRIRNTQSHKINKLEEIDLLKLFKTVGDLIVDINYIR